MSKVRFDHVRKVFGDAVAVDDLTLEIASGEFVSLLGPSGCGKTTTLRMLAGLEQPSAGTIAIGGRVVNEVPPAKRDIAMVFQSYALYPHMTVAQNIGYPLRKRGIRGAERERKVREAAAILQLEPLLSRKPRQLSGGQQQRVALGRALVRDPKVFLLDEPLSNLDAKLRAHMRAELIELRQRIGRTMVYVTHDQLEAMTMSDRIAILSQGVLQQCGTPDEVYHRPANVFVAGFIGTPSMNLIAGELVPDGGGGASFACEALREPLPAGHVEAPAGGAATLGVRPEDVVLGAPGDGHPARVRVVEPTGHETIVFLRLGEEDIVARVGPDHRLRPGDAVGIRLRADKLHLFDAAGGRRLNRDRTQGHTPPMSEALVRPVRKEAAR